MTNNLIKLSLIGMLAAGTASAWATPNDKQQDSTNNAEHAAEQVTVVHTTRGPVVCPDEPHCPQLAESEPEDDQ